MYVRAVAMRRMSSCGHMGDKGGPGLPACYGAKHIKEITRLRPCELVTLNAAGPVARLAVKGATA